MANLTAPGGTSKGFTRLGRSAERTIEELGPLADLIGTWIGSKGWELIAVPKVEGSEEGFTLIVRPYTEIVTFRPIGAPVPNRGGPAGDMTIYGLMYDMRITDLETGEPLHLENGMWLNMSEVQGGSPPEQPFARLACIPHGDTLLAVGTASTAAGPPQIPDTSALPESGPETPLGYADVYQTQVDNFHPGTPNLVLQQALEGLDVVSTTTLSVSTANGGGVVNVPFVSANANATTFQCDYWLETVADDSRAGQEVQQLQYSQQTNLEFIPQFGNPDELIVWPHVNVNTLRKQ
ncbi:MAG TPA: heme-binding protein [Thermoleophilaceae bacterium]|jgi:hypothetical protein